jgi:hypothetical protein
MPRTRGQSADLEAAQAYTDERTGRLVPDWIADGNQLTGIRIAGAGSTTVSHKLGRALRGWMLQRVVVPPGTATDVTIVETASDKNTLTLANGGTVSCTISLWVW